MKCPLSPWVKGAFDDEELSAPLDCRGEECAWWNSELEACAIVSLELELASLIEVLTAIGSKMPHEEQFRR